MTIPLFTQKCQDQYYTRVLRLIEHIGASPDSSAVDLYGLFYDKKDVHYQVSRVRRDQCASGLISTGALNVAGVACEPSAELLALRASCKQVAAVQLEVCSLDVNDFGVHLLVPDPSTVPLAMTDSLKRRLDEVAARFGRAASKKRKRNDVADDQIEFAKLSLTATKVSDDRVEFDGVALRLLRFRPRPSAASDGSVEGPEDGAANQSEEGSAGAPESRVHQPLYLYNPSSVRVVIPPRTRLFPVCRGKIFDRSADDQELPEDGVVAWPWTLGCACPECDVSHLCVSLLPAWIGNGCQGVGEEFGLATSPQAF